MVQVFKDSPSISIPQAGGKGLKILVVDDVQENLELLEDVLAEHGYVTVNVRNGVEALERLVVEEVHLIIADAMMPKMDGFQLCKEVKANPAFTRIPFIIYTANYVDREDEDLARHIGVDRYVVKYAGLGALVEAVNELCRLRYGFRTEEQGQSGMRIDDAAFLEKHHAILVRKLEEKMAELEMYAGTLSRKNQELQASEQRYRSLFEQASIAIFVLDSTTSRVLDVNTQGLALARYTRDELLALPAFPLAAGALKFSPPEMFTGEATIRTGSGETLEVDVNTVPIAKPDDTRVMVFVRDISTEKKMRQQLMQAEKMMLMGCLAAGIAHDIRNPLAAISLNLQYLVAKLGGEPSEKEAIDCALEGTRRIEQIIENTLGLARLAPPDLRNEEVNAVVTRALWFLKMPAQQKSIRVETILGENLPPIIVDSRQIQQVMMNLMQNAIEASPSESTIRVRSALHESRQDIIMSPKVVIAIEDQGSGIAPEHLREVFKPLRTTKVGGTGLGLALAKHIMDLHHGEIHIDSRVGEGTTVQLVFPTTTLSSLLGGGNVEG